MKNKFVIIENSSTAFYKIEKYLLEYGENVVRYQEIEDALHSRDGSSIAQLIENKISTYSKEISAFIIDLQLNDRDKYGGLHAIKSIRSASNPNNDSYWRSFVPIIVYTNYPDQEENAMDEGASIVIKKIDSLEEDIDFEDMNSQEAKELNIHLSTKLLPNFTAFCNWYTAAINNIERSPIDIKGAEINFYRNNKTSPSIKHGFIMTSFDKKHDESIKQSIQEVEEKFQIKMHIANSNGETANQLLNNIMGLMNCCDFGVGIYFNDYKKGSIINPNLSLEVGYMLGLNKEICYLKNVELDHLNNDLASKIYTKYKNKDLVKYKKIPFMKEALIKWIEDNSRIIGIRKRK